MCIRDRADSNGRLLVGIWRDSLHVTCGLTACTPGSAPGPTLGNEYGKTVPFLPFTCKIVRSSKIVFVNELTIFLKEVLARFKSILRQTYDNLTINRKIFCKLGPSSVSQTIPVLSTRVAWIYITDCRYLVIFFTWLRLRGIMPFV